MIDTTSPPIPLRHLAAQRLAEVERTNQQAAQERAAAQAAQRATALRAHLRSMLSLPLGALDTLPVTDTGRTATTTLDGLTFAVPEDSLNFLRLVERCTSCGTPLRHLPVSSLSHLGHLLAHQGPALCTPCTPPPPAPPAAPQPAPEPTPQAQDRLDVADHLAADDVATLAHLGQQLDSLQRQVGELEAWRGEINDYAEGLGNDGAILEARLASRLASLEARIQRLDHDLTAHEDRHADLDSQR